MGSMPRTIKLKEDMPFEEVPLTHQTLFHVYFEDKYPNDYKWCPRWKDVQAIFYRAWEVEEKNNPGGVWDEEFKKMAKDISEIRDYKLPVKIRYSGLTEVTDEDKEKGWIYRVTISILKDEEDVEQIAKREMFRIGNCKINMSSLSEAIHRASGPWSIAVSKGCQDIYSPADFLGNSFIEGIQFWIWITEPPAGLSYQAMCREIAGVIRSHIRRVILDSRNIQKGIEDTNQNESELPF